METLLLNKEEVGSLIDLDAVRAAVEDGYRSFNNGLVVQPNIMDVTLPGTHEGVDFKGGLDMGSGYITLKASSGGFDNNPKLGLPTGMNTVLLFEAKTCALKCIMDGTFITGCRTGAAGAISVKYLARAEAEKLCIIGAGSQARRQLSAIMRVRQLSEVRAWDALPEFLDAYVKEMSAETGLKIRKCATAEEAVLRRVSRNWRPVCLPGPRSSTTRFNCAWQEERLAMLWRPALSARRIFTPRLVRLSWVRSPAARARTR